MRKLWSLLLVIAMCLSAVCATAEATSKAWEAFEEPVTVKAVIASTRNENDISASNCWWNEWLLEKLNIKIEWMWEVPGDQYATKLSATLASGDRPDILQCNNATYTYLKDANALADLSDVWEEYASEPLKATYAGTNAFDLCTEDGKLYAIPYASDTGVQLGMMYYRTDWLENVGLEMPKSLDEFTDVIKAFRDDDPDGNGEQDTYGLALYSAPFDSNMGMNTVFAAFGAYPNNWIIRDGEIVRGLIQPETKEALDYLRELYAEGYIDPEYATLSWEQAKARIADGKLGAFSGMWYSSDSGFAKETMLNDENASFEVDAMYGPDGQPAKMIMGENGINSYNVVLSNASEEAKIAMIKMLNVFYDFCFYFPAENGGSGWDIWIRTMDSKSEEYKAIQKTHYTWWMPVNIWPANDTVMMNKAMTETYLTGELHPYLFGQDIDWGRYVEYAHYDRADMQTEADLRQWIDSAAQKLSRMNTEDTVCGTYIADKLRNEGYTELAPYYGSETETGLASSSTLYDYAVEYINRYIMGMEEEDSWDEFVANYQAMGGEAWAEEVNAAYDALH